MRLLSLIEAVAVALDAVITAAVCLLMYYTITGRWPWE